MRFIYVRYVLPLAVVCGVASPTAILADTAPAGAYLMVAEAEKADVRKQGQDAHPDKEAIKKLRQEERKAKKEKAKKEKTERKAQNGDEKKRHHKHEGQPKEKETHRSFDEKKSEHGGASQSSVPPASGVVPAARPKTDLEPRTVFLVRTYPVSTIVGNGVTLHGYASHPGNSVRFWFEWGTSPAFGRITPSQSFTGEKNMSQAISVPSGSGTKYYYRAAAESAGRSAVGHMRTFVVP